MKVIISMSGLSSRFAAAGYDIPKFMIEVDGKTVIQHIIELYPVDSDFLLIINDDHKKDHGLVDYLDNYAETGKEYTIILKKIIKQNSLTDFDDVKILPNSEAVKNLI